MTDALFCVENLQVTYLNQYAPAVDKVSFQIKPGDRLALVGESGCGKSTIGKTLLRLLPPQTKIQGQVTYQGNSLFSLNPQQLRRYRGEVVGLVFQDPLTRLNPLMTIGAHGLETIKAHQPNLSYRQAKIKVMEALEAVKITSDRFNQYPHELSGGMRQRVAIALALLLNPQLIIADEPTTSLDVTVASEILQELRRLCQQRNMALLLISHDLAQVSRCCQEIAVMYQGKIVESACVSTLLVNPTHEYSQYLFNAAKKKSKRLQVNQLNTTFNLQPQSTPLLKVENIFTYYHLPSSFVQNIFLQKPRLIKAVDDISFELFQGEILGIVGESGCGKSTLSRTILQLVRPSSGKIYFQQQEITQLPEKQLRPLRRQLQMIFQDPYACLHPRLSVAENIAEPLMIHQLTTKKQSLELVGTILAKVGLLPQEYAHRYPHQLSGGQQQRVAIARALITHPQLVICDEPVSMLDATTQQQVLDLMWQLKEEFLLTYIFITHDLTVARSFCDRLAVMSQGKIVEIGETETIFSHPHHEFTQKLLQAAPHLK